MKDLLVSGISGKNGKIVAKLAENYGFNLVCGVDENAFCEADCPVYESFAEVKENVDYLIDFSSPALSAKALEFAEKFKVKTVIATTSLSERFYEKAKAASKKIPLVISSNFSRAMLAFQIYSEKLCSALNGDFDCSVIEIHGAKKKDAPSGTAKELARLTDAQNVFSVRAGNCAGEHRLLLCGENEQIELTHKVLNRSVFAKGALEAANFLADKTAGLFSAKQAFGLE